MPAGGAVALGAAGVASSVIGGKQQASAQKNIANSQYAQQNMERDYAINAAQPTTYDLQAMKNQLGTMQNAYSLQQAEYSRDQSMQNLITPQMQQLLQGQNSAIMNPYQDLMKTQQNALMSQLAKNYGSGFGGTTAGQMAMTNWGQGAALQGAQLQQQTLGNLAGLNSGLLGNQLNAMGGMNQAGAGLFNMSNSLQQRQIAASEGTSMVPYAGAGYLGQLSQSGMMGNIGNSMMGAGSSLGAMSLLSRSGGGGGGGYGGNYASTNANVGAMQAGMDNSPGLQMPQMGGYGTQGNGLYNLGSNG